MIKDITAKLYAEPPKERLYHYTNFDGFTGIVESRVLRASDIRYMNDSAELKHAADLIRVEVNQRISEGHPWPNLLNKFLDWVFYRVTNGHLLFAASFRANGNLLSQWRGYSLHGKGVSLGFSPDYIVECAKRQSFQIGRCIYDCERQALLISQVVDEVETLAAKYTKEDETISYHTIFEKIEGDLLRIAAVLKHPSFQEEDEWRVVSPAITDYLDSPVQFREGRSMLVPYFPFELTNDGQEPIQLQHLFLGPTPNKTISMNSLTMYLAKHGIRPERGLTYCQIPFRGKP